MSVLARRSRRAFLSAALFAILGWLVLVPAAITLVSSLRPGGFPFDPGWTLANYAAWAEPAMPGILQATALFAGGAALLALLLGGAIAWLTERTDLPGAGFVRAALLLPMAMPPLLLAVAWSLLASPRGGALNQVLAPLGLVLNINTLAGMVFVQALSLTPTGFLIMAAGLRNIDPALEEAGLTAGGSMARVLRRIVLPVLAPQILSAALFLVIVSLVVLDVPATLGAPAKVFVLSTRLYYLIAAAPGGLPHYGQVSALAVPQLILLLALGAASTALVRRDARYRTISGKAFRPRVVRLGRGRPAALALVALYLLAAVILPLAMLAWSSLLPYRMRISAAALRAVTLDNHAALLADPRLLAATLHSLVVAVLAASGVVALALLLGWAVHRLRVPARHAIDLLSLAPQAIPGVMIGVALIYVYLAASPVLPLYGTIWIIAIAYLTQYLPFGVRTAGGALRQLHPELEEAARVAGDGALRTLRRVTTPLAAPALAAVWLWVFAHSLRELSTALMLQGRDNAGLPTLLWDAWAGGDPGRTAAGGLWLVLALAAMLGLWRLAAR